jgi:hypothetical protein
MGSHSRKEFHGEAPPESDFSPTSVCGRFPDGDRQVDQSGGTIVEIGVPDQLAKGARRCNDLAREAGVSEDGLYRLLRAVASVGLFAEGADRRFKLTPMGQLLRSDHPESLAGYAHFTAHDSTWRPWGQLGYSVTTGMPAFDQVFGPPIFEYLSKNPEVAAVFDDA